MAAPIDFAKNSEVNEHKVQIKKHFADTAWVYDPSKAWTPPVGLDPDADVHWSNLDVINRADLVVAVLKRGVLTVGTVLEVQHAYQHSIPVIVVGDVGENSVGLEALNVPVYENIGDLTAQEIDELLGKESDDDDEETVTFYRLNGHSTRTY